MTSANVPTVSILMNGYNAELYLKDAIDSVYSQTYGDWEIVFVDNSSEDDTKKIVEEYDNKIKYYKTSKNIPLGEARNFGLKYCKGEYIAFLDCDDMYLPDKLEKQIDLMQNGKYEMCYGSTLVIDENGKQIGKHIVKNRSGNIFSNLLRHYEVSMLTVVLKRDFIVDNNLTFNTDMSYCPDHNLFMIVASKGEVCVTPDIVAKYRVVGGSLSERTIGIAPQEYRLTLDVISENNPELRRRFSDDFESAYNKARYYEAVFCIYNDDKNGARGKLREILTVRIEYFLLYVLLYFPISKNLILKLLGR